MNEKKIKEILSMIQTGQISPEEGKKKIDEIRQSKKKLKEQAIVLNKPTPISDIHLEEIELLDPQPNEVQIQIEAFGINFSDILEIEGLYPNMPEYPFTPGCECVGIVMQKGSSVTKFDVGDRVLCTNNYTFGAHATIINSIEEYVYKIPNHLETNDIAGLPLVFMINYHIFEKINLQKHEKILIQGATGGVGHIAVQMAKNIGAEVFVTYDGTDKKYKFLRELNADYIINYYNLDYSREINNLTSGYGVDVVINMLGGEDIQKGLDLLAPNGRYVEIAMVGLRNSDTFSLANLINNQTIFTFDIGRIIKSKPELRTKYIYKMFEMLSKGKIHPHVDKVFKIENISEAYKYMKERKHVGKIIVTNNVNKNEKVNKITKICKLQDNSVDTDIAIIGISGRFGKSKNVDEYWENLVNHKKVIQEIPQERWKEQSCHNKDVLNKRIKCKFGGFIEKHDYFAANFFNISGYEAKYMDPQQRLLLEECWKALENAGYAIDEVEKMKVGTFIGCSPGDYQDIFLKKNIEFEAPSFWGTSPAINAARLAYYMNLQGPSFTIDTACSSSATALYAASQNLWLDECEIAIVGGTFINSTPKFYLLSSIAGMLSETGECRVFDEEADGFIPGEGVGSIILKKLNQAINDGDYIYGVIKGIGCNQDGRTNGITAPSQSAQEELQKSVYSKFNINPETISYIEAHGTGTKLGDPIEINALINSFSAYTQKENFCALGSVKSNIGHTSATSAIASLIKILKAFESGVLPANLNYKNCNKMIPLEKSPFYIVDRNINWRDAYKGKLRAAMNSFGFSGTNVHIVLEESRFKDQYDIRSKEKESKVFIPISVKEEEMIIEYITILIGWLKKNGKKFNLRDIAYTLQKRRRHYQFRRIYEVTSLDELVSILEATVNAKDYQEYVSCVSDKELCEKYLHNQEVEWPVSRDKRYIIPLPPLPLAVERYWIEEEEISETDIFQRLNMGEVSIEEAERLLENMP